MKRYDPAIPRTLFAFAAVAMTVATLAITIVVPAAIQFDTREIGLLTTTDESLKSTAAADETSLTSIDVVARRDFRYVPVVVESTASQMKRKLHG